MAGLRTWRTPRAAEGPLPASVDDIPALNDVFSDAFTERYRRARASRRPARPRSRSARSAD